MAKPKKVKRNIKSKLKVLPPEKEPKKEPQYKFADPYWSHKEAKHLIVTLLYPNGKKATASIMDNDGNNPDYKAVMEQFGEEAIDANTEEGLQRRDDHIKKRLQRKESEAVRRKQEMLFGAKLEAYEIPLIKGSTNNEMKKLIRKAKSPLEVQTLASILLKEELVRTGQIPIYKPTDLDEMLLDKSIEELFEGLRAKQKLRSLYQEFEGVHVDIWYDDLEHLSGQHVWKDDTVYKVKKDQKENTKFKKSNVKVIVENVLLYKDKNMTDANLKYAKELKVGDLFLYDNQILSLHEDDDEG